MENKCEQKIPSLVSVNLLVSDVRDALVRAEIEKTPAEDLKALLLSLPGCGFMLGDLLGVDRKIEQVLRASLESLRVR